MDDMSTTVASDAGSDFKTVTRTKPSHKAKASPKAKMTAKTKTAGTAGLAPAKSPKGGAAPKKKVAVSAGAAIDEKTEASSRPAGEATSDDAAVEMRCGGAAPDAGQMGPPAPDHEAAGASADRSRLGVGGGAAEPEVAEGLGGEADSAEARALDSHALTDPEDRAAASDADADNRTAPHEDGDGGGPAAEMSAEASSGIAALGELMETLRERGRDCLDVWRGIARQLIALRGEFPSDPAFGRALRARGVNLSRDQRSCAVWLLEEATDEMLDRIWAEHPGAVRPTTLRRYWRGMQAAAAAAADAEADVSDHPTPPETRTESRVERPSDDPTGSDEEVSDHPTPHPATERSASPPSCCADAIPVEHGDGLGDRPAPTPAGARQVRAAELDELEALAEDLLARVRRLKVA